MSKDIFESFKTELESLVKKYKIGTYESDKYNGMEQYCGSDYYFTIDGKLCYTETITEVFDSIINSK